MDLNKIYVGDTLGILNTFPDNSIDIIITSPPYNKRNKARGKFVREVVYNNYNDFIPELEYQLNQIKVLDELYRISKPYGHIFYNHKLRWNDGIMIHPMEWLLKIKWNIRQEIIWNRSIAGNIRSWRFWQVEERIYWMQKGIQKGSELESRHAKMTSIWKIFPECKIQNHPAPFPINLPTRCIYSIADEKIGLNILDPYCGIGTTLVVAKLMKHNYICIDCSPEYVALAKDRLDNSDSEMDKVICEQSLHKIKKSYQERKKYE